QVAKERWREAREIHGLDDVARRWSAGKADQERYANAGLEQRHAVAVHPVLAELLAVVRRHDDQRVVEAAAPPELAEELAEETVEVDHLAVVELDQTAMLGGAECPRGRHRLAGRHQEAAEVQSLAEGRVVGPHVGLTLDRDARMEPVRRVRL